MLVTLTSGTVLYSDGATLRVNSILTQPADVTVASGKNATFTVGTTGDVKSYQWQVSKDGGKTWSNVNTTTDPSAKTAEFTFKTKATLSGYQYRCKVTYTNGTTIYTNGATLTVQ